MKGKLFKDFLDKLKEFDIFELGNSAVIYYFLMFAAIPIVAFLHIPSGSVKALLNGDGGILLPSATAFFYLTLGLIAFILGYKLFAQVKFFKKIPNIFKKSWNFRRVPLVFGVLFATSLAVKAIWVFGGGYSHLSPSLSFITSPFYSLLGELSWLGPIALAIAFIYYFRLLVKGNQRYKIWQFIAWATFFWEFFYGFFSAGRFRAVVPIFIYLIVRHYMVGRDYRRLVAVIIFVALLIFPIGSLLRSSETRITLLDTAGLSEGRINPLNIISFAVDSSLGRISHNKVVEKVFTKTEEFRYGETFKSFFISLGPPRFIWKNKPLSINASGNEFGRAYGILTPDDYKTSVSPTIVGDWYINFGVPGIIFGMFLMGALFRAIFDYLIRELSVSFSGVMIYSIFWISIIRAMETWIAPTYAGLVKLFVLFLVIHFFLTKRAFIRKFV